MPVFLALARRLTRLEGQHGASDRLHEPGLAAVLGQSRRDGLEEDVVPLDALSAAELDAKIAAVTGQRGLSLLLRELLEAERHRRGTQESSP